MRKVRTSKKVAINKECDVAKWHRKAPDRMSLLHCGLERLLPDQVTHHVRLYKFVKILEKMSFLFGVPNMEPFANKYSNNKL